MILTYKHIAKIIDLLEEEIRRIEQRKEGLSTNVIPVTEEEDSPLRSVFNDSKEKYEKELGLVKECLDSLSGEVNKINFLFGIKEDIKNV